MTDYDNTNRWTLFTNDRRKTESHPTHTGTININGVEYFLNGWEKTGKNGVFYSGTVKKKDTSADKPAPASKPVSTEPAFDDEIPF